MIQFGSARILWIVIFFKKYRTAGHLVFWKAWSATGHKDKGIYFYTYLMFFSLRGKPFDLPSVPASSGAFDGKTDRNWGASFVVEIWVSTVVTNSINSKVLMVHGCYCLYCSEENYNTRRLSLTHLYHKIIQFILSWPFDLGRFSFVASDWSV